MSTSSQTAPRTRMFARVIGPFLVIVTVTAIARTSDMRTLLTDFRANFVWPWVSGAFTLLIGLVVLALHQHWRGAPAIIVSIVGWLTTLKGFFLMAFPQTYLGLASDAIDASAWWRGTFIVMALAGLYLTFVGWAPTPHQATPQPASPTKDLPRAA
ncbi:hypothetical protein [Mycobacterium ostraviense]|uniref:Uncharacterized protein n=1 Tax=Mycobacterium ostraviense TaxID=2738409 RepID=A0A163W0E6_9MYCO|nr:hypothetical protein [Mycobacterium ostraviense]KZS57865.1 hypothetical protein A4G28_23735 [Mycobacterium ostraviense]UGT89608.1 hypothetical protein LTS72_14115 [Mycobacterium ostraviense]